MDATTIYVANGAANSITEYPISVASETGTIAPTPSVTISGAGTGLNVPIGITADSAKIYVTNFGANTITEYPLAASGNATPSVTISSNALSGPEGIAIDSNTIYVVNISNKTVAEYPLNASGTSTPSASLNLPASVQGILRRAHASDPNRYPDADGY